MAERVLSHDDMGNYETGWATDARGNMRYFLADAGWQAWVRSEYLEQWSGQSSEAIRAERLQREADALIAEQEFNFRGASYAPERWAGREIAAAIRKSKNLNIEGGAE